jgi:hypothetical protein
MSRRNIGFRLDTRIAEAMTKLAKSKNQSTNRFIESEFLKLCQQAGLLSEDFEPLGETRGGDRTIKDES